MMRVIAIKYSYFFCLQVNLSILKDRLYYALGRQAHGVQVPQCPFQKIDVLPEGGVKQQVKTTQVSRQLSGHKQTSHQSQANSTVNTVTTSSRSPYMNPNQYQYSNMNGTTTSQSPMYYNPGAPNPTPQPSGPISSAVSKGKG